MTPERLAEIRRRKNKGLTQGIYAERAQLIAEVERLRAGIEGASDLARILPEQLECGGGSCGCTACDLVGALAALLNPPTEEPS